MENLPEALDALNALLKEAEDALTKKGYTVYARVPFKDDRGYLAFEKKQSKWGLVYVPTGSDISLSLLTTSRETRVAAALLLDDLLRQLEINQKGILDRALEAQAAVRSFLEKNHP